MFLPLVFIVAIVFMANELPKNPQESKWHIHEKQQVISKIKYKSV